MLRNLKNFIFLALGLGLLFLAFRGQDTTQLVKEFAQARYHWILLSIGLGVLSHISRAMRWRMLIRPMGYQVRLDHSLYAVMVGYMVNLAVPRMGEFSRCVVLSRAGEAPANKLFGTVIAERAIDLLALITLFLLTLAFEFEVIWGFISQQMQRLVGRKTETVSDAADTWPLFLALAFGALLLLGLIFAWIRRNQKLRARLRAFWQELREGLTTIGKLENYALFCLHTAFIWLMYYLMGYVAFFALPATAGLDYSVALSTFCLGGLGFAAPVQGGIGAFHWMVSEGLKLYGVPEQQGLVFATLLHGAQVTLMLVGGALSMLMLLLTGKKMKTGDALQPIEEQTTASRSPG